MLRNHEEFKLGVLVSGGGSNLQAIIDRIEDGYLAGCRIVSVVSSRPEAYALERAAKHGIAHTCIARKSFDLQEAYDCALLGHFQDCGADLIVLAGFLTILGETFTKFYQGRIINVHPSLIPSFCGKGYYGLKPHVAALQYGVKITGATVHFVEPEVDAGPIILQKAVEIRDGDTPEILQRRVMEEAEWRILPQAIRLLRDRFFDSKREL